LAAAREVLEADRAAHRPADENGVGHAAVLEHELEVFRQDGEVVWTARLVRLPHSAVVEGNHAEVPCQPVDHRIPHPVRSLPPVDEDYSRLTGAAVRLAEAHAARFLLAANRQAPGTPTYYPRQ